MLIILGFIFQAKLIAALDASCAPGGNFDLSRWSLQLPIGSPGSPTTISSGQLQGCDGWSDPDYFFTESSDGALVMKVPGSPSSAGCVTTPNSLHCRTELRESNPSSWSPSAPTNRLKVSLAVPQTSDGTGTVIGQIHIDDSISSKPVAELYYDAQGELKMGVEQTRGGGNQLTFPVGNVPVGQRFSYEIRYENDVLSVGINGGSQTILSTFQLDSPRSYFKVGNYDQGDAASSCHFFSISTSHESSSSQPIPTWPPQGADGPRNGLGPFNIFFQVDRTQTAEPPSATSCARSARPSVAGDNIVTLDLYTEQQCCTQVEDIKLGNLDSCHNATRPFQGFQQAVGTDMFGKDIHIIAYESLGCAGAFTSTKLTNNDTCWPHATSWSSLKIAVTDGSDSSGCAPQKPVLESDNNVALNLYGGGDCCTMVEDIKLGTLDSCHNSTLPFRSFVESVGANMFGRDIHVLTYESQGCSGSAAPWKLSNNGTCLIDPHDQPDWLSFKLSVTSDPPSGGGSGCTPTPPDNKDNDNTVTIELYAGDCCNQKPVETAHIGKTNVCKKADQPYHGLTQSVGKNLFGKNIHIRMYADESCSDPTWTQASLSNAPSCYPSPQSQEFKSFMVFDDLDTTSPAANSEPPDNKSNDNTATLTLYAGTQCAGNYVESIHIGTLNQCHPSDAEFSSLRMAVGQNLFGKSTHVELFTSINCSDSPYPAINLSNDELCYFGGTYKSFRISTNSGSQNNDPPHATSNTVSNGTPPGPTSNTGGNGTPPEPTSNTGGHGTPPGPTHS